VNIKVPREEMAKALSLFFGTEFIKYEPAAPPMEEELLNGSNRIV
jgi:hypothetical protein